MTRKVFVLVLVLAVSALLITPAFADDVAALYKSKCQACHGPDGKGDTVMGKKLGVKAFSSPEVVKTSDATLIEITTKGKDKMPSYAGKLTADQIKDLVKYIRSLK